jgi:hypothetical protein
VEYLRNHLLDHTQMFNQSLEMTKPYFKKSL